MNTLKPVPKWMPPHGLSAAQALGERIAESRLAEIRSAMSDVDSTAAQILENVRNILERN